MSRFPPAAQESSSPEAAEPSFPVTTPQEAYLAQSSPVQYTWYELLDYTSGAGFLHFLIGGFLTQVASVIDFRVTIDGGDAIELSGDHQLVAAVGQPDITSPPSRVIPFGNIRFSSSLKVEASTNMLNSPTFRSKVYYSTE